MAAYTEHAFNLGFEEQAIYNFMVESLVMITKPISLGNAFKWVVKTGEYGVKVELPYWANTSSMVNFKSVRSSSEKIWYSIHKYCGKRHENVIIKQIKISDNTIINFYY